MDISPDPTPAELKAKYVAGLEAELRSVEEATSYIGDEGGRAARVKDVEAELEKNGVNVDELRAAREAAAKAKGGTETAVSPGVK